MKTTLASILLCLSMYCPAQSIETSVFANSGNTLSNTSNILSFTIGETFIGTLSNVSMIDQGFWSGIVSENILSIEDIETDDNIIALYPNPTANFLNIKFTIKTTYNITLFNSNGQRVMTKEMNSSTLGNQINISSLSPGFYVLSISIPTLNRSRTFKVVKK
ncbi:T9SS type A sorting domain-containing protein [Aquimarina sp. RZ0]|uniref:T9SS type A sorting domain-containing protein n=1 Tax=Aquimarina sp. RZ0 TaxID=2607730 RepID=UPI0011F0DC8D|nr:T9SS type A sorting domain-containing protein [Aquimarina sp. RZ0]KAA1242836.1 T9SS type A sorting domain-containing protein [Aquimarina sp. RZ0]